MCWRGQPSGMGGRWLGHVGPLLDSSVKAEPLGSWEPRVWAGCDFLSQGDSRHPRGWTQADSVEGKYSKNLPSPASWGPQGLLCDQQLAQDRWVAGPGRAVRRGHHGSPGSPGPYAQSRERHPTIHLS